MIILNKYIGILIVFILLLQIPISRLKAQDLSLKFNHLTTNNGLPQNSVYSIVKDKYGFMWFGTWGGLVRYDGYSLKVFRANESDPTALPDNIIKVIVIDPLQNIWIETGDKTYIYKYNYEYENFSRVLFKKAPIYVINLLKKWKIKSFKTANNKLFKWTSALHGLMQVNQSSGNQSLYLSNHSSPFALSDNLINYIYLDNSENLWIGTQNGGVNHANIEIKPFSYYYADAIGNGLIDNVVRAIGKDAKGKLWVGSEDRGITIIESTKNGNKYSYFNKEKLIDNRIRSIYCDRFGYVWIGTKGGIDRFDPQTNIFKHYYAQMPGSICNPNVFSIIEDHEGTLWIGTFKGLAKYDRFKDRFICFPSITGGLKVKDIIEDHNHNLWVATEDGGLTKLHYSSNIKAFELSKSVRYLHKEGNENTIINNRVSSLSEDNNGMIWIGTNGGLSLLNPTTNTFKHFSIKSGLSDDLIMATRFDDKGYVWISHKKGLTRINVKTYALQNFNQNDGLQGNEFNQNACFYDKHTGQMYFGGANGLNSFYPDNIKINKYKPRVVLTNLTVMNQIVQPGTKVNNRIILKKSLLCTDEITLTWLEKTFSLEFSALHYANPQGNKYKYKLEGIDKQWISTDASMRSASYSYLPAGTYQFKVYAANSDGLWGDVPATLRIIILPPWWATWWAKTIYIVFACLVIGFIYKYIVSQIEIRKNEEIYQSKLHFFTEISHEFRTPLTLIIDPAEKIASGKLEKDEVQYYSSLINRNAKHLYLLINQLLDFRKLETGHLSLNIQPVDIVELVHSNISLFQNQAIRRNITFSFQSSVSFLTMNLDGTKLNMVLNNLLSNAFKFTPNNGKIEVYIEFDKSDNENVIIKVCDTGVGIPFEEQKKVFDIFYQSSNSVYTQEGSGIGLALTKELVLLHGGRINLESLAGKGTCFSVFLPISRKEKIVSTNSLHEVLHVSEAIKLEEQLLEEEHNFDLPLLLIVDDNTDIRNYIKLNLNTTYRIIMATNGTEGFQQAIDTIPDIVISDIIMPGMNGLELCRLLKSDERTSHIPVVLLTAHQSDESKAEGYETGADAYVTKPFNTLVLRAQIKNLLEQRQRLRELFSKGSDIELKKIAINITDEAFLKKVTLLIKENLYDENFNIDTLAVRLKMSRSQFYRKIKALTNHTLYDFVNTIRMNQALEYLLSGNYTVSEIAYKVGFSLPTNFTRAFAKFYGKTPSKYLDSLKKS